MREAIAQVRRPRRLTFEEGPLADWLSRELRGSVDELVDRDAGPDNLGELRRLELNQAANVA